MAIISMALLTKQVTQGLKVIRIYNLQHALQKDRNINCYKQIINTALSTIFTLTLDEMSSFNVKSVAHIDKPRLAVLVSTLKSYIIQCESMLCLEVVLKITEYTMTCTSK